MQILKEKIMFDWWKKWFEPKPFHQGYLPEREGHQVFFMEFGDPQGKPVLVFHGGPGGSGKASHATFADLRKYRVIVFDQRGCGKSLPMGSLKNNDTQSLLKDVENLIKFCDKTSVIDECYNAAKLQKFRTYYKTCKEKVNSVREFVERFDKFEKEYYIMLEE